MNTGKEKAQVSAQNKEKHRKHGKLSSLLLLGKWPATLIFLPFVNCTSGLKAPGSNPLKHRIIIINTEGKANCREDSNMSLQSGMKQNGNIINV